jgi:hypothetical protein
LLPFSGKKSKLNSTLFSLFSSISYWSFRSPCFYLFYFFSVLIFHFSPLMLPAKSALVSSLFFYYSLCPWKRLLKGYCFLILFLQIFLLSLFSSLKAIISPIHSALENGQLRGKYSLHYLHYCCWFT